VGIEFGRSSSKRELSALSGPTNSGIAPGRDSRAG
jgi:hypothetical protein